MVHLKTLLSLQSSIKLSIHVGKLLTKLEDDLKRIQSWVKKLLKGCINREKSVHDSSSRITLKTYSTAYLTTTKKATQPII